ncbi:putative 39S ribosomal protein L24, mitochondrial [Orchesella cincta]|uniref:Large ribosomal subunit protein uL24m n=1 Tax=Orchesella cincta TaxID=48709 RepID=A0A1D2N6X4_ORCCI|nr:putative 39S ribosomal protein L24, mitochondrial [Orchesella cincta]
MCGFKMRLSARLYCSVTKRIGELTKQYANLPERYIERATEHVEWKTPNRINYLPRTVKKPAREFRFTTNRPWSDEFRRQNEGTKREPVFIEPIKEWMIYRGDRVEVLVGRDRGKHGIVSQVIQERNWVIVAGLNTHFRRMGVKKDYPGMIVKSEAPLLVTSQVALVDPSDNKTTKVEWRFTEDGERVRVSLRTGRIVPIPHSAEETMDYKSRKTYSDADKDTPASVVEAITYEPKLKTFESEIMEELGIQEDRIPKRTFWY